jgi:hypothetical protein
MVNECALEGAAVTISGLKHVSAGFRACCAPSPACHGVRSRIRELSKYPE